MASWIDWNELDVFGQRPITFKQLGRILNENYTTYPIGDAQEFFRQIKKANTKEVRKGKSWITNRTVNDIFDETGYYLTNVATYPLTRVDILTFKLHLEYKVGWNGLQPNEIERKIIDAVKAKQKIDEQERINKKKIEKEEQERDLDEELEYNNTENQGDMSKRNEHKKDNFDALSDGQLGDWEDFEDDDNIQTYMGHG